MAIAIFRESNLEPMVGQKAVLDVIVNRMRLRALSACKVIKQKGQFPWAKTQRTWTASKAMLYRLTVLEDMPSVVPSSVSFFHADYVHPSWGRVKRFCCKIGKHIFYS